MSVATFHTRGSSREKPVVAETGAVKFGMPSLNVNPRHDCYNRCNARNSMQPIVRLSGEETLPQPAVRKTDVLPYFILKCARQATPRAACLNQILLVAKLLHRQPQNMCASRLGEKARRRTKLSLDFLEINFFLSMYTTVSRDMHTPLKVAKHFFLNVILVVGRTTSALAVCWRHDRFVFDSLMFQYEF